MADQSGPERYFDEELGRWRKLGVDEVRAFVSEEESNKKRFVGKIGDEIDNGVPAKPARQSFSKMERLEWVGSQGGERSDGILECVM